MNHIELFGTIDDVTCKMIMYSSRKKAKLLPNIKVNASNFKDLVMQSTIFADKTLFIKTVMEDPSTCLLITMPPRWGKTVNLHMLQIFLEISLDTNGVPLSREYTDNYKLFAGGVINDSILGNVNLSSLKIASATLFNRRNAIDVQGIFPVISIDFKNCKCNNYNTIKEHVTALVSECFHRHAYLQDSCMLNRIQRDIFEQILNNKRKNFVVENALRFLCELLHDHHRKKVWILIDEYDTVLNTVYQDPYFSAADLTLTAFLFTGLFGTSLKSNSYL
jgi:Predicted AAA-ATPase